MTDLKFEQKRSLSRVEAADQLAALAQALREGGKTEVQLGSGVLSLRVPDELHSEVEIEVDGDEIELEIELKWTTGRPRKVARPAQKAAKEPEPAPSAPARPARTRKATTAAKPRRSAAKRA
ncbi:amphi-Trp domain-containing protein [Streptomyces sp. NBC_00239]|uniref:amphi-Trp domain-containing protein n=1 Tax=Streptomyces sp. NBC_00239 TaxID=2903640 RepID=UPI002E2AFBDD|nr:amphi-Trp domain-containing protein [Streptomyces sp. NBC_00239]